LIPELYVRSIISKHVLCRW